MKLNNKQKAFCKEYIIDWNASKAAIKAGYSKRSAKEQGSRLLTNDNIQECIELLINDIEKIAGVSKLRIINRLVQVLDNEDFNNTGYVLKAIDILNKMLGYNAPEKQDITTGGEKINQETTVTFINARQEIVNLNEQLNISRKE